MAPLTAVAVSGGIDSLAAAYLLKQQGHRIVGVHFIHGFERSTARPGDIAAGIGRQLGIAVEVIDCRPPFREKVIDYFTSTYRKGLTPNPCMVCNPLIKFGTVLGFARKLGARRLATGHYARVSCGDTGRHRLLKGRDRQKEQSYFLARLNQDQLAAACFPLGEWTKSDLVRWAAERDLHPVVSGESQDVCFIQKGSYGDFLACQEGFRADPGPIEDTRGNVIGRHCGLHLFTVGQRRGINCPAAEPYYVVRVDITHNRLVVGFKRDLLATDCTVSSINWIGEAPTAPLRVMTRVRYRSQAVASTVIPLDSRRVTVRFASPQSAVTPGQAAVFYQGEAVLGGGWIEPAQDTP